MAGLDRRRFLQLSAAAPPAPRSRRCWGRASPAPLAIPANRATGTIKDVEHVVILMQENRSFDHYFGTLRGVRGFGDPHRGVAAVGQGGVAPGRRHAATSCRSTRRRPNLGMHVPRGPDRTAGTTRTRPGTSGKYDQWVPDKTPRDDGALDRAGHPVPLRARRRVHGLRRLPLLDARPDRPEPLLHVDGLGRQRRQGRRPGDRQRRGGLRLDDLPGAAERPAISWKIYQDIGDGPRRRPTSGAGRDDPYIGNYGDNSLLYFHQYQNAAARQPALRAGAHRHRTSGTGGRRCSTSPPRRRASAASCRRCPGSSRPRPTPSTRTGPPNYGAWYIVAGAGRADREPGVWSKTALFIMFDENDGFFDHIVPPYPTPASRASTVCRPSSARPTSCYARQRTVHRGRTASACACR